MTYIDFVCMVINKYQKGEPIYSKDLAATIEQKYNLPYDAANAACAVALNRIIKNNLIPELRKYQKGIFYKTSITPFGELQINKNMLIEDKYLRDGTGYEGGMSLMNKIGLTTQIPNDRTIITNKATNGTRRDEDLGIVIKPPKTKIFLKNKSILQTLDIMDMLDLSPVDADEPEKIISDFIKANHIDYRELLSTAYKFYSKNTIMKIAWIAQAGGNYQETTF